MATGWQIGIDIGGTFTDVVAFHPGTGAVSMAKVQSRPEDPLAGLLAGLDSVGVAWEEVDDLVHGTTMITNAIVENKLSEAALVATEGFADTLAIGRQNRRHLYRLDLPPKLPPQIPEALRFELRERLDSRGEVLTELSEETIEDTVRKVAASGVQSVAVSLLHAYANPDHEERLGARLREVVPYVALSHRVNPEAREFERTSTTALSAGVMPLAAGYLDRLEARRPAASRLHLFHSAGGMVAPEVLRDLPLGLAFSGPAAGVAAAGRIASELGIDNAISFDMGGTTTDVCLIVDGRAEIRSDRSLGERPLRMPMVAVESIGAGGGSIARLDLGTLRVGPDSAGADPGPACYDRGGTAATVSDANLVLGYLDADRPIGGTIRLDRGAAEQVLTPLATEIGVGIPDLALGIVRVANASMARAVEVAVDTETGEVTVLKSVGAHDVGQAINPDAVAGQIEGGAAMGQGYALSEERCYEEGRLTTPSFSEYLIPTAMDVPRYQSIILESRSGLGPFGAKGIGEPALTPVAPAIANAVADAIGVRVFDLPITPERVVMALRQAEAAE